MELIAVLVGAALGGLLAWVAAFARTRTKFESTLRGAEALAAAASAESATLRSELEVRRAEIDDLRAK